MHKADERERHKRKHVYIHVGGILWIIMYYEYQVFHHKHMMDWSPGKHSRWKLQFHFSCPVLTIVNEFSFTKGGCPTVWPHWAPHRSTGPWTRHSLPQFFIFQCGQEPTGFIGVFKSYCLKHSSSISTRSRQFPFLVLPRFIIISHSSRSLCAVDSLSHFQNLSHSPVPTNPPSYPQSSPQWFRFAFLLNPSHTDKHVKFSSFLLLHCP